MAEGAGELGRRRVYPNSMGLWPHPITPVTPARPLKHPVNCPFYPLYLSCLNVNKYRCDRVYRHKSEFNYELNLEKKLFIPIRAHGYNDDAKAGSCWSRLLLWKSRFFDVLLRLEGKLVYNLKFAYVYLFSFNYSSHLQRVYKPQLDREEVLQTGSRTFSIK